MKKYLIILLLFVSSWSRAQFGPCGDQSGWEWWSLNANDWQAYIPNNGNQPLYMNSPFINPPSSNISDIILGEDILPDRGWILLFKNFGCLGYPVQGGFPNFILYNRYTGVMRVFQYTLQQNTFSGAMMEVTWSSSDGTSLLQELTEMVPITKYHNDPTKFSDDKKVNYIKQYYSLGAWFVSDVTVDFDPETYDTKFYKLSLSTYNRVNGILEIEGVVNFDLKGAEVSKKTTATSNNGILKWATDAQEFIAKVPKRSDLEKQIKGRREAAQNCSEQVCAQLDNTQIGNNLGARLQELADSAYTGALSEGLLAVADVAALVSPVVKVFVTIAKFITHSGTKSSTAIEKSQPMTGAGKLKLKGNIETTTNATNIEFQLPGGNHPNDPFNNSTKPFYDCPLGVATLRNDPKLLRRSVIYDEGFTIEEDEMEKRELFYEQGTFYIWWKEHDRSSTKYYSYKVADEVEIDFNLASGLEIVNIHAALVGKAKKVSNKPAYNLFRDSKSYGPSFLATYGSSFYSPNFETSTPNPAITTIYENYTSHVLNFIKDNTYNIVAVDANDGYHEFSTNLVPLDKFKNTAFVVPEKTDIFIKLVFVMKVVEDEDAAPVMITRTYSLNNFESMPETDVYPFTCEQLQDRTFEIPFSGNTDCSVTNAFSGDRYCRIITTNSNVAKDYSGTDTKYYAGKSVIFNPGFESYIDPADPGRLDARISKTYYNEICVNGEDATHINTYFNGCADQYLKMAPISSEEFVRKLNEINKNNKASGINNLLNLKVYPNPNNGSFTAELVTDMETTIEVVNTMGQVIYRNKINKAEKVRLDLTGQARGVYLVRAISGNELRVEKVIIE